MPSHQRSRSGGRCCHRPPRPCLQSKEIPGRNIFHSMQPHSHGGSPCCKLRQPARCHPGPLIIVTENDDSPATWQFADSYNGGSCRNNCAEKCSMTKNKVPNTTASSVTAFDNIEETFMANKGVGNSSPQSFDTCGTQCGNVKKHQVKKRKVSNCIQKNPQGCVTCGTQYDNTVSTANNSTQVQCLSRSMSTQIDDVEYNMVIEYIVDPSEEQTTTICSTNCCPKNERWGDKQSYYDFTTTRDNFVNGPESSLNISRCPNTSYDQPIYENRQCMSTNTTNGNYPSRKVSFNGSEGYNLKNVKNICNKCKQDICQCCVDLENAFNEAQADKKAGEQKDQEGSVKSKPNDITDLNSSIDRKVDNDGDGQNDQRDKDVTDKTFGSENTTKQSQAYKDDNRQNDEQDNDKNTDEEADKAEKDKVRKTDSGKRRSKRQPNEDANEEDDEHVKNKDRKNDKDKDRDMARKGNTKSNDSGTRSNKRSYDNDDEKYDEQVKNKDRKKAKGKDRDMAGKDQVKRSRSSKIPSDEDDDEEYDEPNRNKDIKKTKDKDGDTAEKGRLRTPDSENRSTKRSYDYEDEEYDEQGKNKNGKKSVDKDMARKGNTKSNDSGTRSNKRSYDEDDEEYDEQGKNKDRKKTKDKDTNMAGKDKVNRNRSSKISSDEDDDEEYDEPNRNNDIKKAKHKDGDMAEKSKLRTTDSGNRSTKRSYDCDEEEYDKQGKNKNRKKGIDKDMAGRGNVKRTDSENRSSDEEDDEEYEESGKNKDTKAKTKEKEICKLCGYSKIISDKDSVGKYDEPGTNKDGKNAKDKDRDIAGKNKVKRTDSGSRTNTESSEDDDEKYNEQYKNKNRKSHKYKDRDTPEKGKIRKTDSGNRSNRPFDEDGDDEDREQGKNKERKKDKDIAGQSKITKTDSGKRSNREPSDEDDSEEYNEVTKNKYRNKGKDKDKYIGAECKNEETCKLRCHSKVKVDTYGDNKYDEQGKNKDKMKAKDKVRDLAGKGKVKRTYSGTRSDTEPSEYDEEEYDEQGKNKDRKNAKDRVRDLAGKGKVKRPHDENDDEENEQGRKKNTKVDNKGKGTCNVCGYSKIKYDKDGVGKKNIHGKNFICDRNSYLAYENQNKGINKKYNPRELVQEYDDPSKKKENSLLSRLLPSTSLTSASRPKLVKVDCDCGNNKNKDIMNCCAECGSCPSIKPSIYLCHISPRSISYHVNDTVSNYILHKCKVSNYLKEKAGMEKGLCNTYKTELVPSQSVKPIDKANCSCIYPPAFKHLTCSEKNSKCSCTESKGNDEGIQTKLNFFHK